MVVSSLIVSLAGDETSGTQYIIVLYIPSDDIFMLTVHHLRV